MSAVAALPQLSATVGADRSVGTRGDDVIVGLGGVTAFVAATATT